MKFKPSAIEITIGDPFKDDLLSRKDSAEVLTEFVGSLGETFVLGIDSPWGTGKTTFLKMWLQHLKNLSFPCLYFNAWENDFSDSPLVSLIGELEISIDALRLGERQEAIAFEIYEKTKKAAAALLKAALPSAIKLATAGVLDFAAIKQTDLANLAEEIANKQIEEYKADKATIADFRRVLSELVKIISDENKPGEQKPVIFIIDELDRCRPTYAVELLENVKHLFSVEGLVFVLAIDKNQLAESVKSLYGSGMDAQGYLRRFIDLDFRFPIPNIENFVNGQFMRFGISKSLATKSVGTHGDIKALRILTPRLLSLFGFSLRTQEQCFTQLAIVLRATRSNEYLYSNLLVLLICLRIAKREIYDGYVSGHLTYKDVLDFILSFPGGEQFTNTYEAFVVEAHLIYGIRDIDKRRVVVDEYRNLAHPPNPQGTEKQNVDSTKSKRAQNVVHHFQWIENYAGDMVGFLHKKIELAERFTSE
jgi:hypothetical protein